MAAAAAAAHSRRLDSNTATEYGAVFIEQRNSGNDGSKRIGYSAQWHKQRTVHCRELWFGCLYLNETKLTYESYTGIWRLRLYEVKIILVLYGPVVTTCTSQWSLCVPHSGHYVYLTVVTMSTSQWSLCVPHSSHYVYLIVVNMCTSQWSLCVPHSGQYVYLTVVNMCTSQ